MMTFINPFIGSVDIHACPLLRDGETSPLSAYCMVKSVKFKRLHLASPPGFLPGMILLVN